MAIYYVRPDGNDANTGTGSTTAGAWQTITKAIGASGIAPGDTLYIAPGVYRGTFTAGFTNPANSGQRITISGDPTAAQFTGVTAGDVIITNYIVDTSVPTSAVTLTIAKDYITFTKIRVQGYNASANGVDVLITGGQTVITNCVFESLYQSVNSTSYALGLYIPQSVPGLTFSNNFVRGGIFIRGNGNYTSHTDMNARIFANTIMSNRGTAAQGIGSYQTDGFQGGIRIYNNVIIATDGWSNAFGNMSSVYKCQIYNNVIYAVSTAISNASTATIEENYNYLNAPISRTGCNTGANSVVNGRVVLDYDYNRLVGASIFPTFGPSIGSPTRNAGTNTLSSTADMFGVSWLNATTPTIGGIEYQNISSVGQYNPTERNPSTITIAPGSTSQSIELYLGATGITASTSGLSARYNRTRTASVSIPLVARTIAQAWTSGGFAEVDATNMPGVYRVDLPDAALAAGADDVTIVVRGASGTNGAVMTVKLSSGGLTAAQTASAVWGALTNDHTTHGTFGWNVLRADQDSKEGLVTLHQSGGVSRVDADIHAIANDTDAATELKGALLHNGTDYISADLLTPVSAATSVHIGPYQLLADGLGADQPLDVNVGTATSIDVQVTDANGTGIDITGATVSAKVYNSGGTLVATYNGTATYADNGRLSFGLTTTVTNTSGTYTVTVTRTTGASDTQVFGPLKLYVRPV